MFVPLALVPSLKNPISAIAHTSNVRLAPGLPPAKSGLVVSQTSASSSFDKHTFETVLMLFTEYYQN